VSPVTKSVSRDVKLVPDQAQIGMEDILIDTDGGMLRVYMCQPAGHEAVPCLVQCPILNDTGGSSTQNSDAESEKVPDSDAKSDAEPDSDGEWDSTERSLAEVYKQLLPRPLGAQRTFMPATLWQAQMSGASHHLKKLQECYVKPQAVTMNLQRTPGHCLCFLTGQMQDGGPT